MRLSFSTKITDYLSTGKCIFAAGNVDTAPIQYFIQNDSAITVTSQKDILDKFRQIINDISLVDYYSKQACECGNKYHNKQDVLKKVDNSINNTSK